MKKGLSRCLTVAMVVLWLSSCASFPGDLDEQCFAPGDERLVGEFALSVKQDAATHQLLVVNAWQDQQLQFVGFNAVGAKLFHGQVDAGRVATQTSPLYRGPDAEKLIWGLLVHQLRDQLPRCWSVAELTVVSDDGAGTMIVRRKGELMLRSNAQNRFEMPADGIDARVQRLN